MGTPRAQLVTGAEPEVLHVAIAASNASRCGPLRPHSMPCRSSAVQMDYIRIGQGKVITQGPTHVLSVGLSSRQASPLLLGARKADGAYTPGLSLQDMEYDTLPRHLAILRRCGPRKQIAEDLISVLSSQTRGGGAGCRCDATVAPAMEGAAYRSMENTVGALGLVGAVGAVMTSGVASSGVTAAVALGAAATTYGTACLMCSGDGSVDIGGHVSSTEGVGVVMLVDPSEPCDVEEVLAALRPKRLAFVALPSGIPCLRTSAPPPPPAEDWWPIPWPRNRHEDGVCVPTSTVSGFGAEPQRYLVPVLSLPPVAVRALTDALHEPGAYEPGGAQLASVRVRKMSSEQMALSAMPLEMHGLTVEPHSGGIRASGPSGGVGGRWQLSARAQGEGALEVDVAEQHADARLGGAWELVRTMRSQRQEVGGPTSTTTTAACHKPDLRPGSWCKVDVDCGISGETCAQRRCSAFGYCFSPIGS